MISAAAGAASREGGDRVLHGCQQKYVALENQKFSVVVDCSWTQLSMSRFMVLMMSRCED